MCMKGTKIVPEHVCVRKLERTCVSNKYKSWFKVSVLHCQLYSSEKCSILNIVSILSCSLKLFDLATYL